MFPFTFSKAGSETEAVNMFQEISNTKFIGGGTNLIDLMKMNIEKPERLIDITSLELNKIEKSANGNLLIGALVRNSDLAWNETVSKEYPLFSQAILSGASPQLRNMATTGGNLLQRTRCYYFYDTTFACNKRNPGSGCSAINGYNRMHAILGTSEHCIATHPSDMCVALAALDAIIHVQGPAGKRTIAFKDFHLLPGDTPHKENSLATGELVTHIEIPQLHFGSASSYLKIRDRSSYEFALVSAAVAIDVNAGVIKDARIALGGVGTKPWRCLEAEQVLIGKASNADSYAAAADIALKGANAYKYNALK